MYTKLDEVQLKSGEPMEIGVVKAPDPEHAERLHDHLKHKGEPWIWHVDRSLQGDLDELETRYYIGKIGDEIAANVMTVEHSRVGILGHVFTKPHHRRKGAYQAVMARQMDDCGRRGVKLLYLGTGFESPPYWIYHSFGFRGVAERSGQMRHAWEESFEKKFLSAGTCEVREVRWHHWPTGNVLLMQTDGDYLRTISLGQFGRSSFEGPFIGLKKEIEEKRGPQCNVLVAPNGAVMGIAILRPDARWKGAVSLLDVFVHPNAAGQAGDLIRSLPSPYKIQCYADGESAAKMQALEGCGFRREAVLAGQVQRDGKALDVMVYAKSGTKDG